MHKRNTHPPHISYPTLHSTLHTPYPIPHTPYSIPIPHIYGSLEAGGVVLDPLDVTIGDNKLCACDVDNNRTCVFIIRGEFSRHLVVKKKQDLFRSVEVHIPEESYFYFSDFKTIESRYSKHLIYI